MSQPPTRIAYFSTILKPGVVFLVPAIRPCKKMETLFLKTGVFLNCSPCTCETWQYSEVLWPVLRCRKLLRPFAQNDWPKTKKWMIPCDNVERSSLPNKNFSCLAFYNGNFYSLSLLNFDKRSLFDLPFHSAPQFFENLFEKGNTAENSICFTFMGSDEEYFCAVNQDRITYKKELLPQVSLLFKTDSARHSKF